MKPAREDPRPGLRRQTRATTPSDPSSPQEGAREGRPAIKAKNPPAGALRLRDDRQTRIRGAGKPMAEAELIIPPAVDLGQAQQARPAP